MNTLYVKLLNNFILQQLNCGKYFMKETLVMMDLKKLSKIIHFFIHCREHKLIWCNIFKENNTIILKTIFAQLVPILSATRLC